MTIVPNTKNTEPDLTWSSGQLTLLYFQTLIHSMLAEQFNSSSWRQRIMVCKIMPKLHGQINRVCIIQYEKII